VHGTCSHEHPNDMCMDVNEIIYVHSFSDKEQWEDAINVCERSGS